MNNYMYRQITLKRKFITIDEGTMGFHDYVERKESIDDFNNRIIDKMNELSEHYTVSNVIYNNDDSAIIIYNIPDTMKAPCHMCNNALIDEDLSEDTDYSAFTLAINKDENIRLMLCSGNRKPLRIEVETWRENYGWAKIDEYLPRYCPNCGREILEYNRNKE